MIFGDNGMTSLPRRSWYDPASTTKAPKRYDATIVMGYLRLPEGASGGIDARFVEDAKFELEIAGDRFTARGSMRAPYDPQALRVKC